MDIWTIRGTLKGKPVEAIVEAKDHADAAYKAARKLMIVSSAIILGDHRKGTRA
jgi:hypothetical protein